jgi:thermitase
MSGSHFPRLFRRVAIALAASALLITALPAAAEQRTVPEPRPGAPSDRAAALAAAASADPYVDGEVLVGFSKRVSKLERRTAVARRVAGARVASPLLPSVALVELPAAADVRSSASALAADPAIAWAEPNWLRHPLADPDDAANQWNIFTTRVDNVWNTQNGAPGTVIAVIDSGIQASHPDLDDNLWSNPDEIAANGIDDDDNGNVDDVYGWDFVQDDAPPQDTDGHGTHVAGIAAAETNGVGVSGVCPDCRIMALRVAGGDQFPTGAIAQAIRYAADEGASVINMSFGGAQWSRAERSAIVYAANRGVVLVAAAGNESINNDQLSVAGGSLVGPPYPASYDVSGLISVAASNSGDRLASFSNVGNASVDVAAPGVNIRSTYPTSSYTFLNGTSMASPFVAGVAALLRTEEPGWGPVQTKNAIMNGVDRPNTLGNNRTVTDGRVDALTSFTEQDTSNATPRNDDVMSRANRIRFRKAGSVSLPKDVNDIFKMRLRRGRDYAVLLRVPRRRDFDLFVWKPGADDTFPNDGGGPINLSSFLQTLSLNGKGADEFVRFRARRSGIYYFHVNAWRGAGRYTLFVGVPG